MEDSNKTLMQRIKDSKVYRHSKILADSASFALLLSIACFLYETIDSKIEMRQVTGDLKEVQNSLSTRYIGLFPEYITNINVLLEQAVQSQNNPDSRIDTIIIFQDVLYYGVKSRPEEFRKMNEYLFQLDQKGCHIFIAYYTPNTPTFRQMIRETCMAKELLPEYDSVFNRFKSSYVKLQLEIPHIDRETKDNAQRAKRIDSLVHVHFNNSIDMAMMEKRGIDIYELLRPKKGGKPQMAIMDSIYSEIYYEKSKSTINKDIKGTVKSYLRPIPLKSSDHLETSEQFANLLAQQVDTIKHQHLAKPFDEIKYVDMYDMYAGMTQTIADMYVQKGQNIEIIPLTDYLTMSCWLISGNGVDKAIFAFPSKYATDEIGFYSQDGAIANYIHTMLVGVKNSQMKY